MDWIEYLPNSNLQTPFWSMPLWVLGKLNDDVWGYDVAGLGRGYKGQEGVQHVFLVSISSLYAVALFGYGRVTVWIQFNTPKDLAENSHNTFLRMAAFITFLIGKTSMSSMVQGIWRAIQNNFIKHHREEASIRDCLHYPQIIFRLREEKI